MTTIPSRLAQLSRHSSSPTEARNRVLKLYRDWYRAAPEIGALYALTISPQEIRRTVRQKFEDNRYVSDPKVIDILIHKGQLELQETMNCWKQEPHILGILLNQAKRPQKSFLQKFYEGRDEDAVLPAATGM